MQEQLEAIGLNELQAKTYLYLLSYSSGRKPNELAAALGITRTNAYKVLDQLCELDLARRSDTEKTYRYYAENPIALASFVAEARHKARELEQHVKASVSELQKQYQKNIRHADVRTGHGTSAILQAYTAQSNTKQDVYFVRSRHDIPFLGFETMERVRTEHAGSGQHRFGITQRSPEVGDKTKDALSNLQRVEIASQDYTSPVEWITSGDELAIVSFVDKGSVIRVKDPYIAESFRELWRLIEAKQKTTKE